LYYLSRDNVIPSVNEESLKSLDELLNKCLHCGLCLPVCPTYNVASDEKSSPRGRIRLIRSVHGGDIDISKEFVEEMNFCLDCQACETACPAGVSYGMLVEDARNLIAQNGREPFVRSIFKKFILNYILASRVGMKTLSSVLRFYQYSGLREAVERSNVLRLVSERFAARHDLLPRIHGESFTDTMPEVLAPVGEVKGRVAFLTGCLMNTAFADVHKDCVEVLVRNGYEVHIPKRQVCCGSLHAHNGEKEESKRLAEENIEIFSNNLYDAIVVDSAGCAAFMKEYQTLFADDARYSVPAERVSSKTREITEFLVEHKFLKPTGLIDKRVTYHEACHLVHAQKISNQPREVIMSIPGIEFVELPESTWCCGSAGIYNVMRYDDSMIFLSRKMNNLDKTRAEIVLTSNPGCHLQLQHGIKNENLRCDVMHPVSLLNSSYKKEPG
jgi:glycolate oxidase iron-sulfur subunit